MSGLLEAYSAIAYGDISGLKNILDSGFDINVSGGESTLLSAAVNTGNIDIVKLLIDYDADVNIRDGDGITALFSDDNEIEILKLLIDAGADVNIQKDNGKTALFFSNYETTKLLIDAGVDVNIKDNEGNTALTYTDQFDTNVMKLLIDSGADVNIQDKHGKTVLFSFENIEDVKLIIEAGAILNIQDRTGRTALFYSDYDKATFLLQAGALLNIQDNDGRTVLFYADYEITRLLLDTGVDVNVLDNDGKTALFYSNYKKVALLIDAGVDVNVLDKDGKTALYYFSKKPDYESVQLLVSNGANINFSINEISNPKIKKYLSIHKDLWKRTVREKLLGKMKTIYDYRSEKVCDVFNVLDKEELSMVANLYGIDEKLSRFQICQKLKVILDGKIKEKEEALGTCNNMQTGILQTDIKDIDPRSFFTFEENGKIYCEEVEALYEQIFIHDSNKNAFTNQPFSEDMKKRVKKHYTIYIKDKISEETPQETLTALYAKLHGFLFYPATNKKFEDSNIKDLKKFVATLPVQIQKDSDLLEYKKNIMKGLIDYIEDDQDISVQPDGRRIKTSAIIVTQLWNNYYQ
jgi:ankyrin repeat protein